jgi:hypothetical protein
MANQTQAQIILPLAQKQGLLLPSKEFNPCLHASINSANLLLYYLAQAEGHGLDVEQIFKRSQLHPNTCKVFLRVLVDLGLVLRTTGKNRSFKGEGTAKAVWSYRKNKSTGLEKSISSATV